MTTYTTEQQAGYAQARRQLHELGDPDVDLTPEIRSHREAQMADKDDGKWASWHFHQGIILALRDFQEHGLTCDGCGVSLTFEDLQADTGYCAHCEGI